MCNACGFANLTGTSSVLHEAAASPPSYANLVVGYTPPSPLPNFTDAQIVQAMRTSWLGPVNGSGDYPQDTRTFDWGGTTIWYRLVTTAATVTNTNGTATAADDTTTNRDNMSATEQTRIAEALEIWDDIIRLDISNDQLAGTPGHTGSFFDVFYVTGGTASADGTQNGNTSGQAFANYTNTTTRAIGNNYGTQSVQINNANLNLGRSFNSGEFDGTVGNGGAADGGADDLSYGKRGFETVLHEMGHALGLSHPGFYNAGNVTQANGQRFAQDTLRNTIMSYNSEVSATTNHQGINASTPMIYDILAVEAIYGLDTNTRRNNETYGFNNTSGRAAYDFRNNQGSVFTIYDAGGADTIDASGFDSNSVINLTAGTYSSIGDSAGVNGAAMLENIGIAFGTIIENAIGGSGGDAINGNSTSNRLWGNGGGDTIQGFDSGDYLYGGEGDDALYGGSGYDWLVGGGGADYIDGGFERDTASYEGSSAAIVADLQLGKVLYGDGAGDTIVSIESINGSAFDDEIGGSEDYNVLSGGEGSDRISGRGGRDDLNGDGGNDFITGVSGDRIRGGGGIDTVIFASTADTYVTFDRETFDSGGAAQGVVNIAEVEQFYGKAGADTMRGDFNDETFFGFEGGDILQGRNGNDTLEGGAGADALDGGIGSDTASYSGSAQGVAADLGLGKYLYGDAQDDTLASIENLTGSAFDDDLRGDANTNVLRGLAGDDDLYSAGGADLLEGGIGNDTYIVDSDLVRVRESAAGGYDTVLAQATFSLHQTLAEVEVMRAYDAAGTAAINLYGSNHTNTIIGNAGNNILSGRGGNDFLVTGIGADTMDGGDGYDTMVFHKAMVADWQSGVLDADIGGDGWIAWEAIQGSAGADRIRTNSWGYAVELRGGAGDDVLATGVSGLVNDILSGEDGNDEMNGGAGADAMIGGLGNDIYYVDNAGDSVTELGGAGSGVDWVRAALSAFTLGANVEKLAFTDTGDHVGKGNALANTLNGNAGDDKFIMDAGGNDVFSGGGGSDSMDFRASVLGAAINLATGVHGGAALGDIFASIEKFFGSNTGADTMRAGAGRANFSGFGGDDTLIGGNNTDTVSGGDGADTLYGGSGADTLWGGKGNDRMNGGSGEDLFLYVETAASGGWGADTITDFQDGVDLIKIDSPGVADAFSDFTVTGNGTANVLIRLAAAPANTISLNGPAPITITAADFLFY